MKHITYEISWFCLVVTLFAECSGFNTGRSATQLPQCVPIPEPNVDALKVFPTCKFDASWISHKFFWTSKDFDFESRSKEHLKELKASSDKLVKVFVLPHSHNDAGWLNTYEQYYAAQTHKILDNAVSYLTDYPEMTFVWAEITYLAKWWGDASPQQREQFKVLVDEGRLEIVTGGWTMADEATSSLYALVHELTEGQQWVRTNLHVKPKYGWAIDPFGHSSAHSHLLKLSNIEGMVLQRLHYVWKHWLAEHKKEFFRWRQRWDISGDFDISCHTLPYDLYSIKHACGPQPDVCLKFDFRKIPNEYSENIAMTPVTDANVKKLAEEITGQYHKTASLTDHNVVLVPLGDDFRYDRPLEWEQQYSNYMQLFTYINSHKDDFKMEIGFGTPRQFFEAVETEYQNMMGPPPSLAGDFFPYGDVYVAGHPSYWTGFYGSRPYWKRFHREVESEMRTTEILFTYAHALARQADSVDELKAGALQFSNFSQILGSKYQDLVNARREFALFTHHDGITGTSKRWTMEDYGNRLHTAYKTSIDMQIQILKLFYESRNKTGSVAILKDFTRNKFDVLPQKILVEIPSQASKNVTNLVLFNSLAWERTELVKVLVKDKFVRVKDSSGANVPLQINPVFHRGDANNSNSIHISDSEFELAFLARLQPLSVSTFQIRRIPPIAEEMTYNGFATVSCGICSNLNETPFINQYESSQESDEDVLTSIENSEMKLYFQESGLLDKVVKKGTSKTVSVSLSFGQYDPVDKESGAYLLKPKIDTETKYFSQGKSTPIIKITGPVMSQVVAMQLEMTGTILVNTTLVSTEISTVETNTLDVNSILLENFVDFSKEKSKKVEVFMRIDTSLKSSAKINHHEKKGKNVPHFYTDQNGLVVERRVTLPNLDYEGNVYPVTSMAYIQDEEIAEDNSKVRLSVLVDRTHGFCSMKEGRLETLIERRSTVDDQRGMSEGVTDSKPTVSSYRLILENLVSEDENSGEADSTRATEEEDGKDSFFSWQATLQAHRTSVKHAYLPQLFLFTGNNTGHDIISLISSPLPDNVHLLNLRTLSEDASDNPAVPGGSSVATSEKPGDQALLNLMYLPERQKGNCVTKFSQNEEDGGAQSGLDFKYVKVNTQVPTSLTGLDTNHKNESGNGNSENSAKSVLSSFKLSFK